MTQSDAESPPAEYGILPRRDRAPIEETERERLYDEYGRVRTYFKLRPAKYLKLQRWLTQARIPTTYDQYLASSVRYAALAAVVGALAGIAVTWLLATAGVLAGISTGFRGPVAVFVSEHRLLVAAFVLAPVFGGLFAVVTWLGRYYYPSTIVSSRRQNINVVLPHAIVYMYALSYGGMSLPEVMRSLANAEEDYGEVAREFERIMTDTELFGSDLYTALRNARDLTPSDNLKQFLDDMISLLEAGGDVSSFFEEESATYLREAEDQQAGFLETLSLMAEMFIAGFIATPLFVIVTLVVISFIGGDTIPTIGIMVYLVLPVATVAFLFLMDFLGQPYEQARADVVPDSSAVVAAVAPKDDDRFEAYRKHKQHIQLRALLRDPLVKIRARPVRSLALSVPAAVALAAVLVLTGAVTPSLEAMRTAPISTTTGLIVAPLLVAFVPLSAFHEYRRRRERQISRRFPDTLNILSSANKMGIPLTEALDLVTRWSTGPLAEELRTVRNDIEWNHDTRAALLTFGIRLGVPQLSRTMKLLADGLRSSGDLSRVLSIAASDTRNRDRLERTRQRELSTYIAVVVIGFLVYLFVILMLDVSFLRPLTELSTTTEPGSIEGPVSLVNVPIETYQMVFFHSALIMAVSSGLIAGKLADNDSLSGLKYAILLVVFTLITFAFI
jgi:flagellar protein FlaJ